MRQDYKMKGSQKPLDVKVELEVMKTLELMSEYTKLEISELVNTACKRFISQHKDFLPPEKRGPFSKGGA